MPPCRRAGTCRLTRRHRLGVRAPVGRRDAAVPAHRSPAARHAPGPARLQFCPGLPRSFGLHRKPEDRKPKKAPGGANFSGSSRYLFVPAFPLPGPATRCRPGGRPPPGNASPHAKARPKATLRRGRNAAPAVRRSVRPGQKSHRILIEPPTESKESPRPNQESRPVGAAPWRSRADSNR